MALTHDPDTEAVILLLREALATSGLSQATFARALGTSGPRLSTYLRGTTRPSAHLCMRARRLALALAATSGQGLMTAPATALAVRQHLEAEEVAWAWRLLLQGRDHLRLLLARSRTELLGSWEAAPSSTGSLGFDALLAALTRHEFEQARCAVPEWTKLAPLADPWLPEHPFLSRERVVAMTPEWLRELNIFVPDRDLVTA